ncbi:MAG: AtpZ/AtpI family protein [Candidatus Nomurabacteria bacterium]|nr:AtpZ/AtpI family protein [Candidatus Nomurabacteria bacterium]USN87745.1 MAG: AtpZ/AtpI family protein [Candidatus Nomurabacteria bacterium]
MTKETSFKLPYALSLALQLGFLIVSSVVGFLGVGLWLDSVTGKGPIFLLLGIIVGVVTGVYESYIMVKPLTKSTETKSGNELENT